MRREDLATAEQGGITNHPAITAAAARRALRSEPLTTPALRQLGLIEASEQRIDTAAPLMRLAYKISRHDLPTLLWSIYGSAMSGEVEASVQYTDEALSISETTGDVLFPGLAASLADPATRKALVSYVRRDRPWIPDFLRFAASSGGSARYVADLVIAAGGLPHSWRYSGLSALIFDRLAANADFVSAEAYMRHLQRGCEDFVGSASLTPCASSNADFGPFAWTMIDASGIGGQFDAQNRMQVHASAWEAGRVAAKTIILKGGDYYFTEKVSFPGAARANASWELRCIPSGEDIWTQEIPVTMAVATYRSAITVPARCVGQQLILRARNNDDQGGAQIVIEQLSFKRRP